MLAGLLIHFDNCANVSGLDWPVDGVVVMLFVIGSQLNPVANVHAKFSICVFQLNLLLIMIILGASLVKDVLFVQPQPDSAGSTLNE